MARENALAEIIEQLMDGQNLLRRPIIRDLEEHFEVRPRHGCAPNVT
jgi:hypothetical protein